MSSSSTPIPVRVLHPLADPPDEVPIIELPMTAADRRRVRRLLEASDGVRLALELPTGTVLRPGQILHHDARAAYVVSAAAEDVLVVHPRDLAEAARVGHLIGNMHRDIHASGDDVVALADDVLADRLARAGVQFERSHRPFHGKAPGEHAH